LLIGLRGVALTLLLSACAATTPTTPQQASTPSGEWLAQQIKAAEQASGARPSTLFSKSEVLEEPASPPRQQAVTLFPGTGQFIDTEAAGKQAPLKEVEGEVTLNFELADIRDVVKVVFDTLQENYVIDPQVQGEVTVQTSRPLPKNMLIPTLESLLSMNGAALIREQNVYKIVPATAAAASGNVTPRLGIGRALPGYGLRIVPLRFISAAEMQKILQPLLPEGSILVADNARNLLILAGSAQELAGAEETINIFDVNWLKGMSIGMYTLSNVDAEIVATELGNIFGEGADLPISGMIRFVPISKLNAVMAITAQPEYLQEIGFWIQRLDSSAGERLHIYAVQNSKADYVASLLGEVFGGVTTSVGPTTGGEVAPGRSGAELSSPESMLGSDTNRPDRSPTGEPQPLTPERTASRTPRRPSGGGGERSGVTTGEVRIIADTNNNSLLIWANNQDYQKIQSALRRLDVAPRQVLIEVTIAEVTLSGTLRYGLQWWFKNDVGRFTGIGTRGQPINQNVNDLFGTPRGDNPFPSSFAYALSDQAGIVRALLEALATESKLRVLSSPQVMVIDNQEATIRVGNQQPISTGTTTTEGGNVSEAFQLKDTGVLLTVVPQVNDGGLVNLDVSQEVIDVGPPDEGVTDQRSFFERSIKSKVAVQSGETIVLGGLIRESIRDSRGGIPVLYKIPYIGSLFGNVNDETDRTELIVLITPRLIRDRREAQQATEELKQRMKEVVPFIDLSLKNDPNGSGTLRQ
jgi:general secretion pathway protein D